MNWMPIPALGGVNLFDDPRAIRDEEVQWARNLVPLKPGILKKRGGLLRPYGEFDFFYPSDVVSAALMSPISQSISDMVVVTRGSNGCGFIGVSFASGLSVASSLLPFDHQRLFAFSWDAKIYGLPGPDAQWIGPSQYPYYIFDTTIVSTSSAPATAAFAGAGNENVYPSVASPYKSRLVLANFGKGYENTIAFTDDFSATVVGDNLLASNGRAINLKAAADGDEIVAMIEVMLTSVGSPAESGLLILQRHGAPYLLTGDMDQTTGGTSTLDIKRMSVSTGCAGPYTVVRTPVGIVWAGADDVWCFAAGVLPHRLGLKIQPALKVTPAQLQYRWTAAYADGFYRLAVWGAGQPLDATSAPGDQWWLDLRDGLPRDWREAKWWGPQQYLAGATPSSTAPVPATWGMVADTRAGQDPILRYVALCDQGFSVGEYDPIGTRDLTVVPLVAQDYQYLDPEVTAELITKEYALAPARDQINDGILMALRPSNDLTLKVDFVIDDGDQISTRTKYLAGPDIFRLDSSRLDTAGTTVNGKAIKTALYPQIRRAGQTHTFRIYDTAGWTLISGFNNILIVGLGRQDGGTPAKQLRLTVPAGNYTMATLVAAINNAPLTDANGTSYGTLGSNTPNAPITTSILSGLVTFDDSADPSFLNFVINMNDNVGADEPFATIDDWLICSRLAGGILGFSGNSGNPSFFGDGSSAPNAIASAVGPFKKGISDWEIYGVAANMEVLPRTP